MSLISRLFHRKGQKKQIQAPGQGLTDYDMEEEDPEDEEETAGEEMAADVSVDDTKDQETYEILEREILPAKIICPDCGGITLEGLEFCDKCGGELQ
jgi:hypothetical protein